MKRFFIYALFLSCLAACTAEGLPHRNDVGTISVTLATESAGGAQTKASVALTPDQAAEYTIGIYNEDGTKAQDIEGNDIEDARYADFKTVKVNLSQSYYVTAYSCTPEEADAANDGKGGPRYAGSSEVFTLNASNISENARVECSQTNAKVTVVFDATVLGKFSGLKVELKSENRSTITVSESEEPAVLYFNPGVMTYSITGSFNSDENYGGLGTVGVSLSGSQALEAKDNYRLVIRLNMDYGKADVPAITVDEEFHNEGTGSGTVDPYDYVD